MTGHYFSDRELGPRPRTNEEIDKPAWFGIVAAINSYVASAWFGYRYPLKCVDGGTYACNERQFALAVTGETGFPWPIDPTRHDVPPTPYVLDLLEFCHARVAKPVTEGYHDFFHLAHIGFDLAAGQAEFREEMNRILARNGLAYELKETGRVERLGPPVLAEALRSTVFDTGDDELDKMLESARTKFLDPDPGVRAEALEKLWDAWERLKTLESGKDKLAQVTALLDRATSNHKFRKLLEDEAAALTKAGNTFQIRHSETTQEPLEGADHVDYMFHRMFAMTRLMLKATGRGG